MWGIIQKKDTHTLDFDVTPLLGLKQLTSLIFRFAKIYYQQRFNDRSKGFPFGQQLVKPWQDSYEG